MGVWFVFRQRFIIVPVVLLTGAVGAGLIAYAKFMGRSIGEFKAMLVLAPLIGFGVGVLGGIAGFFLLRTLRRRAPFTTDDGESVLHEGPAKHRLGPEVRSGRLTVTDRRVVFEPNRFAVQRDRTELAVGDLQDVSAGAGSLELRGPSTTVRFAVTGGEAIAAKIPT